MVADKWQVQTAYYNAVYCDTRLSKFLKNVLFESPVIKWKCVNIYS